MSDNTAQSNQDRSWLATRWHELLDAYTKQHATSADASTDAPSADAPSTPVPPVPSAPVPPTPAKKSKSTLRVQRLEIAIGQITAQISETKVSTFELEIGLPILDDATWQRITDTLGSQALFAAQMLAGNLPFEIQHVFEESGTALLPVSLNDWSAPSATITIRKLDAAEASVSTILLLDDAKQTQCMVAVFTMLGKLIEDDPWLLLELHGRTQPQILQALRESRVNIEGTPPATGEAQNGHLSSDDAQVAESSTSTFYILDRERETGKGENESPNSISEPGLEDDLDRFWGAPKRLKHIHHQIETPEIDLILLRRLGPPPFHQGSIELYEQLEALYRQVSERAIALAYTADARSR